MKLFIKVLIRTARTMHCRLIEYNEYLIDRILRFCFGGQREPVYFNIAANVGQTVARLKNNAIEWD